MTPLFNPEISALRNLLPEILTYLGVAGTLSFRAGAGRMRMRRLTVFRRQAVGDSATAPGFRKGERVQTYRDYPAKDRTTRYDDVWGG